MKLILVALFCIVACNVVYGWADPYNQMEGKCGCCPLPCCCHCMEEVQEQEEPECPSAEPPIVECKSLVNIGFLVDVSASIGEENIPAVENFIKTILGSMTKDSLSALVSYATNATVIWDFDDPEASDIDLATMALGEITLGRLTNVVEGMEAMIDITQNTIPDMSVPRVYIVLSDGRSFIRIDEFDGMVTALQSYADVVAVVGVADLIFPEELEAISTSNSFTFVDDYDSLKTILNDIIKEVCEEIFVPTTPPCPTAPPVVVEGECFCCCPPPIPIGPPGTGYCPEK